MSELALTEKIALVAVILAVVLVEAAIWTAPHWTVAGRLGASGGLATFVAFVAGLAWL